MSDTENMLPVTADAGIPLRRRTWGKVVEGRIAELATRLHHLAHPFADHEAAGGRVLDLTGVEARVGDLVDAKGNATPPEGRAGTIPDHLPAYHEGPGQGVSAANTQAAVAGNAPVTERELPEADDHMGGDATLPAAEKPADTETGKTADGETPTAPAGFAAVDALAHD